jgi:Ca-activated chloride channel family protein
MSPNRLIMRILVLSIVMAVSLLAVIAGCSSAKAPRAAGAKSDTGVLAEGGYNRPPVLAPPLATANPYSGLFFEDAPRNEELWVIEKPQGTTPLNRVATPRADFDRQFTKSIEGDPATRPAEDVIPGTGQLVARLPDKLVPVPLQHTDVKAAIAGYVATVDVTQQYKNPYNEKIEAIYVFPLPTNAAVNEFLMTIGDRKIRGIIREREEAKQIYEAAKRQGYVASLLSQERPNVFTQSIANIEAGKKIDVSIKYFHTLEYVDGWYEYVFPMVVGPRFNPSNSTDGIGAKAHGSPVGSTGQRTEIAYLKDNERSGHDISLSLDIDAGVKVEDFKSINHKIKLTRPGDHFARITLSDEDKIPNKDFVFRYKVAGKQIKSALMAQRDEKGAGGYFTLMLFPPESLSDLPRKPIEMVFTLDVSGSMEGRPIEQAKTAVTYALNHMRQDDTFNVVRFANTAEPMAPRAVAADRENIQAALNYMQSMSAGSGTMMIDGIRQSLQVTPDPDRLRFVTFLTDGFIGNEREILAELHRLRGPSRVFSFGVGSSTNRYLLDHMARLGQGCAAYLNLNDDAGKVMSDYFEHISHPALTDLSIQFDGMQVSEIHPQKLPDLFVGRPIVITGRYTGNPDAATAHIKGKVGGETRDMLVKLNVTNGTSQHKGIAPVWARARIADLYDRTAFEENVDLTAQIKQTALEYGLMSAFTSFIAVDSSARTAGDHGTSVSVPVPVPQGVRYDTTVPQ